MYRVTTFVFLVSLLVGASSCVSGSGADGAAAEGWDHESSDRENPDGHPNDDTGADRSDDATGDSGDSTPSSFAEECSKIQSYAERHNERESDVSGPQVVEASELPDAPEEVEEVVLHTVESSIASRDDWIGFVGYGPSDGMTRPGHLNDSLRGRRNLRYREEKIDKQLSPVQELVDLADACPIRRGLFQSMGRRVIRGDQLHLFECSDGMASLSNRLGGPWEQLPDNLRAAWRIGDAVVRCDAPDLRIEFAPPDADQATRDLLTREELSERIRAWFAELLEFHKEKLHGPADPRPPYDDIDTISRYFYVKPLDRGWRTRRLLWHGTESYCPTDVGIYPCPADKVEYEWDPFPTVFQHWKFEIREPER